MILAVTRRSRINLRAERIVARFEHERSGHCLDPECVHEATAACECVGACPRELRMAA